MRRCFLVVSIVVLCFLSVSVADAEDAEKVDVSLAKLLDQVGEMPAEIQGKILDHLLPPIKKKLLPLLQLSILKGRESRRGNTIPIHNQGLGAVNSIAFSPNGKLLATGSMDSMIHLREIGGETTILGGHEGIVHSMALAFSPDGSILAFSSNHGQVKLWDVEKKKEIKTLLGHRLRVNAIAFHPDGKRLVTVSSDCTVRLWDIQTGDPIGILKGHRGEIYALCFHPDGRHIATGARDRIIKLWDIETRKEVKTLQGHREAVTSVSFHPSGKMLLSGSWDNTLRCWDVDQKDPQGAVLAEESPTQGAFYSLDGHKIYSLGACGQIYLWDQATGDRRLLFSGRPMYAYSMALCPDDNQLAVGYINGTVDLCDLYNQEEIKEQQILERSLYRLSSSQKFLLYLLDLIPGQKNLPDLERRLKKQFGDCSGLLNLIESYKELPIRFRQVVKEHFNVSIP